MTLTLGPLFDQSLHSSEWCNYGKNRGKLAECPRFDYRVTNTFSGPDLVNGGTHKAVDVGNAALGYPVLMPANTRWRRATHGDGARGREIDLGGGYLLGLWHLAIDPADPAKTLSKITTTYGPWTEAHRGTVIGMTGASGGPLADGSPMPAHTHISLTLNGKPVDPEPYLFGAPLEAPSDEMQTFDDVPPEHKFYAEVEYCYANGLMLGYPQKDGSRLFLPDTLVTNERLAAIMARLHRDVA